MEQYLLPILLVLPIAGAIVCGLMPTGSGARAVALLTSLLCTAVGAALLWNFDWAAPGIQFAFNLGEIGGDVGFSFALGIDSISLWLIVLTVFLQPLAIAASFQSIQDRPQQYYAWMLALLTAMAGVFMARDLLLFYIFFELTLIPMFFIIGIWGGSQRRYAAGKFFLFTFAGSVFTLAAVIYLGIQAGSFDIVHVVKAARELSHTALVLVTLGLLIGFAVKVPLFPVHTWLPLAHTEAPTAGSVILAGVLLKLGTYGILRVALPIGFLWVSDGTAPRLPIEWLIKFIGVLCLIGIIYGALVAWVQQDIKKLVAYSSVSHLGFCVLGLAALNHEGVQGSILYMINHGLSTGALFLCVGMIYDRHHTRDINALSGLGKKMPVLAFFLVYFTLSSIGLPGLNGFVSEFLTILGAFKSPYLGMGYGAVAALGIILGAVYMLHMVARVIFGPLKVPGHDAHAHGHHQEDQGQAASPGHDGTLPDDLNVREISILVPIALAVLALGVIPAALLRTLDEPTRQLIGPADAPRAALVAEK